MVTRRQSAGDRAQTGVNRVAILEALRAAAEPMTVQQLAELLGLHQNSVRFHLTRLVHADLIREDQALPTGPGRPRFVYRPVTTPPARRSDGHQLLAEALAEHLAHALPNFAEVATEAGEERGRNIVSHDPSSGPVSIDEAKAEITALMDDHGFDPEWDPDGERLWLRHCPFRPLADEQPTITCSLHLGLLRGALDALDAPIEVASLDAAKAPHPCLAVFVPRKERSSREGDDGGSAATDGSPH